MNFPISGQCIGAVVTVLVAMMLGGIGMFVLGKRQGQHQGETARDGNSVLEQLATVMQGRFKPAGMTHHPMQGTHEAIGRAELSHHGMRAEVSLGYPPLYDNDLWTMIFVHAPAGQHWMLPEFSFQNEARPLSPSAVSRTLSKLESSGLPQNAKTRLFSLAQQAHYLSFDGEVLLFIPQVARTWSGHSYIRDVATLETLVEEACATASMLVKAQ